MKAHETRTPATRVDASLAPSRNDRPDEAALESLDPQLRATFESAAVGIAHLDVDGRLRRANDAFCRIFGFSADELVGRTFAALTHPDDLAPEDDASLAKRVLEGELPHYSREKRCTRKNGSAVWVNVTVSSSATLAGDRFFIAVVENIDARKHAEAALRASEKRFKALVVASSQIVWTTDGDGNVVGDSPSWRAFTGQSLEAWHDVDLRLACIHPNDRQRVVEESRAARAQRVALSSDFRLRHVSGEWRDMAARLVPVLNDDGSVREWVGMVSDVTERRLREAQARVNERLRERSKFFELSADMTCIASLDGRFLQVNEAFTSTLGYDRDEMTERDFMDFVHEDDHEKTSDEIAALAAGAGSVDFTNRYRCKDGSYRWLSWRSNPQPDGTIYAMARDVTAFRAMVESLHTKQESLAAGIREREVLLQEVHHRVKNNLQIVSSMMNMQLRKVAHDAARAALEECQSRVQAIALIHEKLYQSQDYARIPFRDYVKNLVDTIFQATGASRARIRCDIDMADVSLGVDRAIPCGLLLNELVTNALKHAFRDGRDGTLRIALYALLDRRLRLVVADDGVGLPNGFDLPRSESLGLQLVSTLVEQLDAELDIDGRHGMAFRITMPAADSQPAI